MFRWMTAGESHGKALVATLENVPAGLHITTDDIAKQLQRRRLGYGRGARQKFEQDELTILTGVRHGVTLGSPITLMIGNSEWPKWEDVMNPDPVSSDVLMKDAGKGDSQEIARNRPLTKPRPGHADLVGMNKYGFNDARQVLERASARETAARVAAGTIAKAICDQIADISFVSRVVRIGKVTDASSYIPVPEDTERLDASPVRCLDKNTETKMVEHIDEMKKLGDTLGGVCEVFIYGVPQGLGSYVCADRRLDARLAAAFMSIQAVKGVEIGDGFDIASTYGSEAHDEILREKYVYRNTNHAGGIEGGMSNGEVIRVRFAFKPISTVPRALKTIDVTNGQEATALHQRSDTTAVVPGAVIGESVAALVIAQALLEKSGGDSVKEARRNIENFLKNIPEVRQ
ncbi:MAG: chorismate synthase [Actinomycetaceae bacterium]|nr:chorismate synthase [Actinomycetaceae bacterium]